MTLNYFKVSHPNPVLLHIFPSFDIGGLGSLACELILSWPYKARHICVAPHYRQTKPLLIGKLKEIGIQPADVIEVNRDAMKPMEYVNQMHTAAMRRTAMGGPGALSSVIHYNFGDAVWNSMWVRRFWKGTIVSHVGTVLPNDERCWKIVNAPATETNCFVPASDAVANSLIAVKCPTDRLGPTVWNGVDLKKWTNESGVHKALIGCAFDDPRIDVDLNLAANLRAPVRFVFVGRMAPEAKDFELLIRAFQTLDPADQAQCELTLIGDGPKRKEYEKLAAEKEWTKANVKFLGEMPSEATRAELAKADCFIMAALPIEGMSIALVEAIAMGLPIIATDVPANREVLRATLPGPTGGANLLVAREPMALARGISTMLVASRRAIAAKTTHKYRVEFDIKRVSAEYAKLGLIVPPVKEEQTQSAEANT